MNILNKGDMSLDQSLKAYMGNSSPFKKRSVLYNSCVSTLSPNTVCFRGSEFLPKTSKHKAAEENENIGTLLKRDFFINSSPGKHMDLFVPHRTESNFKCKPKTNTLSAIRNNRPV